MREAPSFSRGSSSHVVVRPEPEVFSSFCEVGGGGLHPEIAERRGPHSVAARTREANTLLAFELA